MSTATTKAITLSISPQAKLVNSFHIGIWMTASKNR